MSEYLSPAPAPMAESILPETVGSCRWIFLRYAARDSKGTSITAQVTVGPSRSHRLSQTGFSGRIIALLVEATLLRCWKSMWSRPTLLQAADWWNTGSIPVDPRGKGRMNCSWMSLALAGPLLCSWIYLSGKVQQCPVRRRKRARAVEQQGASTGRSRSLSAKNVRRQDRRVD